MPELMDFFSAPEQENSTENSGQSSETRRGRAENLKPWAKGISGNPGGRPKKKPITEAYERALTPAECDKIAQSMIKGSAQEREGGNRACGQGRGQGRAGRQYERFLALSSYGPTLKALIGEAR